MRRWLQLSVLSLALAGLPAVGQAGWVVEWQNTVIRPNGDRLDPQASTQRISNGRVRIVQPQTTSLIDYDKKRFTILNPTLGYFWSGSVSEYVKQVTHDRNRVLSQRMGGKKQNVDLERKKTDPDTLPKITIEKTSEGEKIAGHETTKYLVRSDDELLQELWVADDLDLSSDIDVDDFLAYERTMSKSMIGRSAAAFAALYRSKEYRDLLKQGYVLKNVTHHISGGFERVATAVRREDVDGSEFKVPEEYRRVRLADVLGERKS
jgi:hypothetical protein